MYILYIEQGCPYGDRVMAFMKTHGIEAELRDRDVPPHRRAWRCMSRRTLSPI